jgi:hypothetical protein
VRFAKTVDPVVNSVRQQVFWAFRIQMTGQVLTRFLFALTTGLCASSFAAAPQDRPLPQDGSPYYLQSSSSSGGQISMCRGSARVFKTSISCIVRFAADWPDDGQAVGD